MSLQKQRKILKWMFVVLIAYFALIVYVKVTSHNHEDLQTVPSKVAK